MFKSLPTTPYRFRAEMSFLLRFFRVNSKGKIANFIMDTARGYIIAGEKRHFGIIRTGKISRYGRNGL